jgi:hypothetical protein
VPAEPAAEGASGPFLVVFEKGITAANQKPSGEAAARGPDGTGESSSEVDKRVAELTQAFQAKEEYLQVTNEDSQSANEALNFSKRKCSL